MGTRIFSGKATLLWVLIEDFYSWHPRDGAALSPVSARALREACMDVHLHTHQSCLGVPVWAQTVVSLCCERCPFIHPCHPASGMPPSASKTRQSWHFGGKYKKPSSGHLEGAGLGSEV